MLLRFGPRLLAVVLLLGTLPSHGQESEKELHAKIRRLVQKNGNKGTDQELKQRLITMAKQDQAARAFDWSSPATKKTVERLQSTDERLTAELQQIIHEKGWPTISLVGLKASQDAALILTHSPDHDFQRKLIPELQQLAEDEKIVGSDIATIMDKVLVSEGKPQRFGTQFTISDGRAHMDPVEDPAHLDQRRAQYLLLPMTEYKKALAQMYHVKIE
jgi:hypothetical protein